MLYDQASGEKKRLEQEIINLKAELSSAPEGFLQCHKNKDGYVRRVKYGKGQPATYLPADKTDIARVLAEKTFRSALLHEDLLDLENISDFLDKAEKIPRKSMQMLENAGFRQLISDDTARFAPDIAAWASEEYISTAGHEEGLSVRSATGRLVRSKSEAFIDWALHSAGLPYRYECDLIAGSHVLHPDFMIMHPSTRDIYLWEHLGLMDNEQYVKNALAKIQLYTVTGYIPSVNLIITAETTTKPLDQTLVIDLIKHYFPVRDFVSTPVPDRHV